MTYAPIGACRHEDTDKKRTRLIMFGVLYAQISSDEGVVAELASPGQLSRLHSPVPATPDRSIGTPQRRRGRHED